MQSVGVFLSFGIIAVAAMNAQAYLNDSPTEDPELNLLKMLMLAQSPTRSGSQVRRHLARAPSTRMVLDLEDLSFKESWELLERARAFPSLVNVGWNASAQVDKIMEIFGELESAEERALAYDQIAQQVQESFVIGQLEKWEPPPSTASQSDFKELPKNMKQAIDDIAEDVDEIMKMEIPEEVLNHEPEFELVKINETGEYVIINNNTEVHEVSDWFDASDVSEEDMSEEDLLKLKEMLGISKDSNGKDSNDTEVNGNDSGGEDSSWAVPFSKMLSGS